MSRSALRCGCGRVLGYQRGTGNVAALADVFVIARLAEGRAMLRCPDCGAERWIRPGVIVRWGASTERPDTLAAS